MVIETLVELDEACIDDVWAEPSVEALDDETTPEAVSGRWAVDPTEAAALLIYMFGSPVILDCGWWHVA